MKCSNFIRKFAKFYNGIIVTDYTEQDVDSIYHYTSPEGFSSIIRCGKFRFTDRFYLNDESEGRYVLELCINNIDALGSLSEEFRKELLNECKRRQKQPQRDKFFVYQCSFSMDKDNLSLWNYYTKSDSIKGYNIKIDASNLASLISPEVRESYNSPVLLFGKVIYDESSQLEILKDIVSKFYEFSTQDYKMYSPFIYQYLVDKIMQVGVFFKMPVFNVEREYRLAFDLYLNNDGTYATITNKQSFYAKNGIFIPYVDLKFDAGMLTGVGISPTLDFEASRESILRIAGNKYPNLGEDAVYKSAIPLRY